MLDLDGVLDGPASRGVLETVETEVKYAGYIAQQDRQVQHLRAAERRTIPDEFSYHEIPGFPGGSREAGACPPGDARASGENPRCNAGSGGGIGHLSQHGSVMEDNFRSLLRLNSRLTKSFRRVNWKLSRRTMLFSVSGTRRSTCAGFGICERRSNCIIAKAYILAGFYPLDLCGLRISGQALDFLAFR